MRLILYKRISSTLTPDDLRELQVELIDRFGLLPDPARNLMRIAAIKQSASTLGIEKIDAADRGGYLIFGQQSHIRSEERRVGKGCRSRGSPDH